MDRRFKISIFIDKPKIKYVFMEMETKPTLLNKFLRELDRLSYDVTTRPYSVYWHFAPDDSSDKCKFKKRMEKFLTTFFIPSESLNSIFQLLDINYLDVINIGSCNYDIYRFAIQSYSFHGHYLSG